MWLISVRPIPECRRVPSEKEDELIQANIHKSGYAVILATTAFFTAHSQTSVTPAEARAIAKEAYIYGFPMVEGSRVVASQRVMQAASDCAKHLTTASSHDNAFWPWRDGHEEPVSTCIGFLGLVFSTASLTAQNSPGGPAHRVVGVGSVGTRAYLALLFGNGDNDPLFITCSISVAGAGRTEAREMLIGMLGCNLAWGMIDTAMYLMACFSERGQGVMALRAVRGAAALERAHRIIADAMPPLWILAVAACCLLFCVRHTCAQLRFNPGSPPYIAERTFSYPLGELPDAPSTRLERLSPTPVRADWLIRPRSSVNDFRPLDLVDDEIPINMKALSTLVRNRYVRRDSSEGDEGAITLRDVPRSRRYNWGGLIAQSFFFNGVESAFRIASDDQIRYLLAKKPFWHDYAASVKHFNMRRWGDGDEFLVNYVGHPMQGAVSAYIAIQNSPIDRKVELSATRTYWTSRFKGFLWAAAFSTHSELSPLGEAGIGNEGGWTYPISGCHRPCPAWNSEKMHYTNNTGWVDFVITPTVGILWVLAEDTLDRYASDRVQGTDQRRIFPKILRGSLNPSRTFANAMRLKKPWYRDFQHDELDERYRPGIRVLRDDESQQQQKLPRFSIAGHYQSMPLGTYLKPCFLCFTGHGGGLEVDYAITPWLSASFALDKQQGVSDKNATVRRTTPVTGFGIRLIHDRPYNTFSLALRPGFVLDSVDIPAYDDAPSRNYISGKSYGTRHTMVTVLFANDYKINRNFAIRSSLGTTVVRYPTVIKDPPQVGKVPYLSWLSPNNYSNHITLVFCRLVPCSGFRDCSVSVSSSVSSLADTSCSLELGVKGSDTHTLPHRFHRSELL